MTTSIGSSLLYESSLPDTTSFNLSPESVEIALSSSSSVQKKLAYADVNIIQSHPTRPFLAIVRDHILFFYATQGSNSPISLSKHRLGNSEVTAIAWTSSVSNLSLLAGTANGSIYEISLPNNVSAEHLQSSVLDIRLLVNAQEHRGNFISALAACPSGRYYIAVTSKMDAALLSPPVSPASPVDTNWVWSVWSKALASTSSAGQQVVWLGDSWWSKNCPDTHQQHFHAVLSNVTTSIESVQWEEDGSHVLLQHGDGGITLIDASNWSPTKFSISQALSVPEKGRLLSAWAPGRRLLTGASRSLELNSLHQSQRQETAIIANVGKHANHHYKYDTVAYMISNNMRDHLSLQDVILSPNADFVAMLFFVEDSIEPHDVTHPLVEVFKCVDKDAFTLVQHCSIRKSFGTSFSFRHAHNTNGNDESVTPVKCSFSKDDQLWILWSDNSFSHHKIA